MRRFVLSLVCAALLSGCPEAVTELVVVVDTDFDVPAEMDRVHFSLDTDAMDPIDVTVLLHDPAGIVDGGPDAVHLPVSLGLVPAGDVPPYVSVVVSGLYGVDLVVRKAVRVRFIKGETRELRIELTRACATVMCADVMTTCEHGACRSVDIAPNELLPFNGTPERFLTLGGDGGVPDGGLSDVGQPPPDTGCSFGFAECDGQATTVCETNTQTDRVHCGTCGNVCWGRCIAGACDDVVQLEAGTRHTCARTMAGDVYCWGDDTTGADG